MAIGRAYQKGEAVEASRNIVRSDGDVIRRGTRGRVTNHSARLSATVRVKFHGVGGAFRVVPKNCVRP